MRPLASLGRSVLVVAASSAVADTFLPALAAQVPGTNRYVHPTIATPGAALAPTVLATLASPHFAANDGVWSHGDGFVGAAVDRGGWRRTTRARGSRLATCMRT